MPRIKDYIANQPDLEEDDLTLIWDRSTDTTAVSLIGRLAVVAGVGDLPDNSLSHVGWLMFVANGRKVGEEPDFGSGVLVYFDGNGWVDVRNQVAPTD